MGKNVAASVRQRLLNVAREGGETYDVVLSRYVRERFLYRLGQSDYRDRFIVKGATLFLVWSGEPHRITSDLDLLGYGASSEAALLDAMRAETEGEHVGHESRCQAIGVAGRVAELDAVVR